MTATRTLPSPVQSPPGRSWSALAVLMIGTFMFVLDFFIVNVALPAFQQGLRAGEGAIEWIVAGYAISTAVLLVTGGRLGDQFGRRRVFAIGMTVFVLTSAACALAPDPAVLVTARILQGVGAALMAPNILSILGVVYSGPARVRAISVYGMVMGLAAVSGSSQPRLRPGLRAQRAPDGRPAPAGGRADQADAGAQAGRLSAGRLSVARGQPNMECKVATPSSAERTSSTTAPAVGSTVQAAQAQHLAST